MRRIVLKDWVCEKMTMQNERREMTCAVLDDQMQDMENILNLHAVLEKESSKAKGNVSGLEWQAFMDKFLYYFVFLFYLGVCFYVICRRVTGFVGWIFAWYCWFVTYLPVFNYYCPV